MANCSCGNYSQKEAELKKAYIEVLEHPTPESILDIYSQLAKAYESCNNMRDVVGEMMPNLEEAAKNCGIELPLIIGIETERKIEKSIENIF